MTDWTHTALVEDLARSRIGIGEAVVTEMGLGLRYIHAGGFVDVASFRLSWTHGRLVGWEVKVSRADFRADVRARKWERYVKYFDRFFFAAPVGMLKRDEIPEGCGLAVRGSASWSTIKASRLPRRSPEDRRHALHALLMALHPGPWKNGAHKAARLRYEYRERIRQEGRDEGRRLAQDIATGHIAHGIV